MILNTTLVPEIFLELRESQEAVKTSRETAGSDTLRLGFVDIFTTTQINMIVSFHW